MQQASETSNTLLIHYLTLRRALGLLGMLLPLILALGGLIVFGKGLQESISGYYHTGMRDVFVGIIFATGLFLASYTGHKDDAAITDNMVGNFASVGAIGLALFPTTTSIAPNPLPAWVGVVHLIFSALFFLALAYFAFFQFTKTHPDRPPTPRKLVRNQIYRVCGVIIFAAIILIAIQAFLPTNAKQALSAYKPVFWLESLAVVAFGISWLIKGETLWQDQPNASTHGEGVDIEPRPA